MVEFDWTDPLNLEGCLTEEEVMVRDAAQSYAQVTEHRLQHHDSAFPKVKLIPTFQTSVILICGERGSSGLNWSNPNYPT